MITLQRFDVLLVALDPTLGSELKKTRPCVVISPDSMNRSQLKTIIVAPLTSVIRLNFPTRILVNFQDKPGQIALDQLRVIDRARIVKNIGAIETGATRLAILKTLRMLFIE